MKINPLAANAALTAAAKARASAPTQDVQAPAAGRVSDKMDVSGDKLAVGQALGVLQAGGDVRTDLVSDIKAQIEAGTYDFDGNLDVALDRMIEDFE